MNPLTFTLPAYPHLGRFSAPPHDFNEQKEQLECLAARKPESLSAEEICFIFNAWMPAGSFEEMAPYVPRALDLLQSERPDEWSGEIVHVLLAWCYAEQEALRQDACFSKDLQAAFLQLFLRWTSTLASYPREGGGSIVTFADHIENLLRWEHFAAEQRKQPILWLQPEHFLAHLYKLESIEQAVLALWVSDREEDILPAPLRLAGESRLRAMQMVENRLCNSAGPEEADIWRSTLEHHQQEQAGA